MNAGLNQITILGRLGNDPITRNTRTKTTVTHFDVAVDESYKSKAGDKVEKVSSAVKLGTVGERRSACCLEENRLIPRQRQSHSCQRSYGLPTIRKADRPQRPRRHRQNERLRSHHRRFQNHRLERR